MNTIYTWIKSPQHEFPDHPERPGRLDILESMLPGLQNIEALKASPITREEAAFAHHPKVVSEIERACQMGPGIIDYAPTFVTKTSFEDALLAAGGAVTLARAVYRGEARNGFAIVRPPGHHAQPDRAMGFCLLNNIAIAARDALNNGASRVLVVDFDAHHGNGTQAAFWENEQAAFLSTHQWGIYPGSGSIEDAPYAKKRIVNVPLPSRAGDAAYARIADDIITPFVRNFKPGMMLVSAGFDSHWNDPITSLGLTANGYFSLSKKLVELAGEFCDGKIVFVLEGGYDPLNVANGAASVFSALTGLGSATETNDINPHPEPDCEELIEKVRAWHGFSS